MEALKSDRRLGRASPPPQRALVCPLLRRGIGSALPWSEETSVAVRGIGVDVVKVERLIASLERFGSRFEARLYTDAELEYCRRHKDPIPHLAARFAAK